MGKRHENRRSLLSACPVSIECKVITSLQPGNMELFVASIEAVHCDEQFLDEDGNIDWTNIPLL